MNLFIQEQSANKLIVKFTLTLFQILIMILRSFNLNKRCRLKTKQPNEAFHTNTATVKRNRSNLQLHKKKKKKVKTQQDYNKHKNQKITKRLRHINKDKLYQPVGEKTQNSSSTYAQLRMTSTNPKQKEKT